VSEQVQPPDEPTPEQMAARPREHLANERTLLAWARTAITFEALGFGVSRFDILLRQSETGSPSSRSVVAAVLGIVFVVAGLLAAAMGTLRFFEARRQIESGGFHAQYWPHLALMTMMGLLGVGLIAYLAANS
jgi:putative membrane protein